MSAPQRLQAGSLQPSANPVSNFLQFDSNSRPAAPARPQQVGQVSRVTGIQRGGRLDVQGVNQLEELATALAPLTKLYDTGVQLYASNEYKQGQNEILKAAANINRDQVAKGLDYAEQNRQLDAVNPVAGILMDQANPFRQAGRVNQASQWVASLTPSMFREKWQETATDLRKLDPSDPAILAVKAQVTNELTQSFGLDEFSAGFQQYVAPQINRSWEWFEKQQYESRVAYEKEVGSQQTAELMVSMLTKTQPATASEWLSMLHQQAATFGLAGEPMKMTKDAILAAAQRLRLDAAKGSQVASDALVFLEGMPSGLTSADGSSLSIADAYGVDLYADQAKISRDMKAIRDNNKDLALSNLETSPELVTAADLDPQSTEYREIFDSIRSNPAYVDLSDAEIRQELIDRSNNNQEWQSVTFDPTAVDRFFYEVQDAFGSDWDEAVSNKIFRQLTKNAPQKVRQGLRERYQSIRDDKRREQSGEIDSSVMKENVDNKIKAFIKEQYPKEGVEILRWINDNPGGDLITYLGSVDSKIQETVNVARYNYRQAGVRAIRQKTAEAGGQLRPEDQAVIWGDMWNKEKSNYIPLSDDTSQGTTGGEQSSSTTSSPAPTFYSRSQPVPAEVVRSGVPVYKPTDVMEMAQTLANGGAVPAQVKRSARAVGMTPGEFLLKQAEALGLPVPEPMQKSILRQSNRSMGLQQSLVSMAPPRGPLSQSTGVLLDILSGTAPSYSRPIAG